MSNQPIILLTFAKNDLKKVSTEAEQLREIVAKQSQIEGRSQEDLTAISLNQAVAACGNRLLMYHFSGHASPSDLELDDFQKLGSVEFSRILIPVRDKLSFVFLNGCRSYGHIAQLTAKGVKALIVSNTSIGDTMAMKLSSEFYDLFLLKGYTLKSAFEAASAATVKGYKPNPILVNPGEPDLVALSHAQWVLVINADYQEVLNWRLEDFINPPKNNKIPRLLTANAGNPSYFLGREADLAAISTAFSDSFQPLFLVNGEGGIGKTTLASRYWHLKQNTYKHLGWLNAALGVKDAILSLAYPLGIQFEPRDTQEIQLQKVVQQLLDLAYPVLLVLDNADNLEDLEDSFMILQSLTNCHILVTTRVDELADARVHRVEALSPDEALELFAHHYKRVQGDELAVLKQIFEAVDYNTLVIELLAKNLKVLNRFRADTYPIAQLLDDLQKKSLLTLDSGNVYVTYHRISLKKEKPEAVLRGMYELYPLSAESILLLSNFSVLPSVQIPFETFHDLLQPTDMDTFQANLDDLRLKGWIRFDSEEFEFKVSPVVQAIIRDKQKPTLFEDCAVLLKSLKDKLFLDQTQDNPVDKFVWVPFGKAFAHHFDERTEPSFATFQNNLALRLKGLGDYLEAKRLLEKSIHSNKAYFGEGHWILEMFYSNLALVLQKLGDYLEAKRLLKKAVRSAEAHYGSTHPITAIRYANLAMVHKDLGEYLEAKRLLEKVVHCNETNFGELHPATTQQYSNLALVLKDLGDYLEAKRLLEKAILLDEAHFGANHPATTLHYFNLAAVLKDLGKYSEAKELLKKVIYANKANFGERHPSTAESYSGLAIVLQNLGEYSEAKQLFEKAMRSDETNFGEHHPTTVSSYSNFALVLYDLGEYSEAKRLLEKAVRYDEATFGETHPIMASRYSNLAVVLKDLGDYSEAKRLLEKAMCADEVNFGETHLNTAVRYSNLALVLKELGDYSEAKRLLEKAMHSYQASVGTQHPAMATIYSNLATVIHALGDYSEAKVLLEKAMRSDEANFGEMHPQTASRYSHLALVLKDLGEYSEAKQLLKKAMCSNEVNFGEMHMNTVISYFNLALVLKPLGEYSEAKRLLEKVTYFDEVNFGTQHPTTAVHYANLGMVLNDLGEYSEAKRLLETAYKIYHNYLGAEHSTTKNIKDDLDSVTNAIK